MHKLLCRKKVVSLCHKTKKDICICDFLNSLQGFLTRHHASPNCARLKYTFVRSGHTEWYRKGDKLCYECKRCHHRASLRKGTVMENSKLTFRTGSSPCTS